MKPKSALRSFLFLASSSLLAISYSHATPLYWDVNDTAAGFSTVVGAWGTNVWNDTPSGTGGITTALTTNADDLNIVAATVNTGTITVSSAQVANSITYGSTVGAVTISGAGGITLGDGLAGGGITVNNGAGAQTISTAVTLNEAQTWTNNSANTLTVNGGLTMGAHTLTIDGSGTTFWGTAGGTYGGGAGGLIKSGTGRFNMGAAATVPTVNYTGQTQILGGVLMSSNNMPTNSNVLINGGVWEEYWSFTLSRTLGNAAGNVQITGGVSGFSENGSSGMTINFGGTTEVQWGSAFFQPTTLVLQESSAQSNSTLDFQDGIDLNAATRTVTVNKPNTGTGYAQISGLIRTTSGTAGLVKQGQGVLRLTNTGNTFNGQLSVENGVLYISSINNVSANGTLGNSSLAVLLGSSGQTGILQYAGGTASSTKPFTMATGGTGAFDVSTAATNLTLSGPIDGSGALTKNGTGTLTFSGTNTYGGVTTVNAGTLAITKEASLYNGVSGSWTAANINVKAGAGLALNLDSAGSAGFTVANLNTLLGNISAANSAAQGLQAGITLSLDTSTATGGTFTQGNAITNSTGAFGGVINLTKLGAGTLVLDKANTYTGLTTISGGTLQLNDGGSISNTLINNGVLLVNKTGAVTIGTDFPANVGGAGSIGFGAGTTHTITTPTQFQFSALNTTGGGGIILSGVTTPVFGGLSGATGDLATVISSGYGSVTNLTLNTPSGTTFTYGGVIADGAAGMSVTKIGGGTQILTGNNTYTGTTFLNGGTLTVGSGATIGKLSGTTGLTFNGGTLQFNRSTNADIDSINNAAAITVSAGGTFSTTSNDAGGASANENIGAVTLNAGQMNFNMTNNASSGWKVTMAGLTQNGTSAATFSYGANGTWTVTGAAATAADQIIGPWATIGGQNGIGAQTDYAIYNGSSTIAARALGGAAETAWTTAANAYTNSLAAQTLTGTRTITALRNNGGTATLTLATGANLETYGVLNGVATLFTIAPGTGGVLTTPTGGGNLYLTPGAGAITVSAPINNNGGNVTLVKSGSGTLTLTSTTSNFSGGVVLNAGTLAFDDARNIGGTNNTGGSTVPITVDGSATMTTVANTAVANLGTGAIGINTGAILTLTGGSRGTFTIGGAITGDGGVTLGIGSFWGKAALNSTSNTFKGALTVTTGNDDGNSVFSINSIADGAGYGNIVLNVSSSEGDLIGLDYGTGGTNGTGGGGAIAPLVLNHRKIVVQGTSINVFNNASNQAVTINTDIGFSGTGARSMRFGVNARSGSGISTFAGKLTDNVGGAFSPTFGGGTWVLTNANTYTGNTTVSAGTLNINSATALGTGALTFSGNGTFDNTSVGAITLANNNPLTLSGGSPTFAGTQDLNLGTGAVTISGANRTITVTNSGATLTLGGGVTADNSGNRSLTKDGAGMLALNGAAGTWTGGVAINRGTLKVGNATALGTGPISFNSSANAGTLQNTTGALINMSGSAVNIGGNAGVIATITGTAGNDWSLGTLTNTQAGNAVLTVDTVNATLAGANLSNSATNRTLTIQGTGNTTIAGTVANGSTSTASGLTKNGSGTLTLNGANTYDGATTVSAGEMFVNGDQSGATGAVSVSGLATLGGTGTIGGNTTIADTGKLEFNLSSGPGSHDKLELASGKTLTFSGGSTLTLTSSGGATTGLYTLVTAPGAASISGSAPASVVLPVGWTADPPQIVADGPNTSLKINITSTGGGGSPYTTWSGGAGFGVDTNGDGVKNGLAWVLGAADKDVSALGLLPTIDNSDPTYFIFNYRRKDDANTDANTTITAQYGTDLTGWTNAVHNGTTIIITPSDNFYSASPGVDKVEVKIDRSLAPGGKLFLRLNTVQTP